MATSDEEPDFEWKLLLNPRVPNYFASTPSKTSTIIWEALRKRFLGTVLTLETYLYERLPTRWYQTVERCLSLGLTVSISQTTLAFFPSFPQGLLLMEAPRVFLVVAYVFVVEGR